MKAIRKMRIVQISQRNRRSTVLKILLIRMD